MSDSATPWTVTHQAPLPFTISWSLLKFLSTESVMPSNHLILCHPSPPALRVSQHQGLFQWVGSSHQVAKGLEFQLQHQSLSLHLFKTLKNNLNAEANTEIQWCSNETDSSVTKSCLTLCNPVDCSTPGFLVHHQLPEFTQTHVHRVGDAIQPSHPLSSPSPPTFNLSQHQGLFKWVSSSHQVAKGLEFQLQHQSFQRIFRADFL